MKLKSKNTYRRSVSSLLSPSFEGCEYDGGLYSEWHVLDVKQIAPCEKDAQEYAWYVQTGRIKSNPKFDPIQKRIAKMNKFFFEQNIIK